VPEAVAQLLRDHARNRVGDAARTGGNDESQRLVRIVRRRRWRLRPNNAEQKTQDNTR
jgi:hypothetical protein